MSKDNKIIIATDTVADSISSAIEYEMLKDILIKPLPPIKVTKQFQVPVEKNSNSKTKVKDYDEVKTETKEVDSNFAKGVVLKLPIIGCDDLTIGQTVVYNKRFSVEFDLFKNSVLVKPYDIIAVVKDK